MPAVSAPAKVLVTGANGYLGVWLVRSLLEHGYHVRGTVRTTAKGDALKLRVADLADKFEYVLVDDVLKDGAFDDAVHGIDIIMHTLSPNVLSMTPEEVIGPAVKGTVSILESAEKHQDTVKRVVITGSIGAIMRWPPGDPRVYDESVVNEAAVQDVEQGSKDPVTIYCASKTKAEQKAWAFMKEKEISKFDLVFLNGAIFIGPPAHPIGGISEMTLALQHFYLGVIHGRTEATMFRPGSGWIDVRDVALSHILAAQKPEAGGQRIILSAGDFVLPELNAVAHAIDPALPKGEKAAEKIYQFNSSRMRQVLGLVPRSLEDSIRDSLAFYKTIPGTA